MSMTKQIDSLDAVRNHQLSSDRRQFNLIFALAFGVFLVGFALSRVLPGRQAFWTAHDGKRRSIFEKARTEANILASFALTR